MLSDLETDADPEYHRRIAVAAQRRHGKAPTAPTTATIVGTRLPCLL